MALAVINEQQSKAEFGIQAPAPTSTPIPDPSPSAPPADVDYRKDSQVRTLSSSYLVLNKHFHIINNA
jgi:hypothetical protein